MVLMGLIERQRSVRAVGWSNRPGEQGYNPAAHGPRGEAAGPRGFRGGGRSAGAPSGPPYRARRHRPLRRGRGRSPVGRPTLALAARRPRRASSWARTSSGTSATSTPPCASTTSKTRRPFPETHQALVALGMRSLLVLPFQGGGALAVARRYGWAFVGASLHHLWPIRGMAGIRVAAGRAPDRPRPEGRGSPGRGGAPSERGGAGRGLRRRERGREAAPRPSLTMRNGR